MTPRAVSCGICGLAIDWTGADSRRAPGLTEDGCTLCASCANDAERHYETFDSGDDLSA